VPSSAISQHAGSSTEGLTGSTGLTGAGTSTQRPREQGFWSSLFGGEPEYEHDTAVYDRSLQGGSTVVTVRGSSEHLTQVLDILERHNPIDIDERAQSYGLSQTSTSAAGLTGAATTGESNASITGRSHMTGTGLTGAGATGTGYAATTDREPGTIQLSEEQLVVGKRAVNRGTTRVRRYVIETPVEEQVSLHDERVTVERRPVTGDRAVSNADFSEKVIEVTETGEEAIVSKQARVREEVVIRKDATDRTETVRDTVRREDVEITKDAGAALTGAERGTGGSFGSTDTSGTTATTGTTGGSTSTTSPYKPKV
jgi:uncharacterized protein (TIGR02271 family)